MSVHSWIYAAACVLLPILWGLAMVRVTNWFERRYLSRRSPGDPAPSPSSTLEYHI